jgi:hypothetical protein
VLVRDPEALLSLDTILDCLDHMRESMGVVVQLLTSIEERPDGSILAPLHVVQEIPFPPRWSGAGGTHGSGGRRSRSVFNRAVSLFAP